MVGRYITYQTLLVVRHIGGCRQSGRNGRHLQAAQRDERGRDVS
jgi:hypothetical protein